MIVIILMMIIIMIIMIMIIIIAIMIMMINIILMIAVIIIIINSLFQPCDFSTGSTTAYSLFSNIKDIFKCWS